MFCKSCTEAFVKITTSISVLGLDGTKMVQIAYLHCVVVNLK